MNIDTDTITIQDDGTDSDGGMILSSNYTMGQYDSIRLIYVSSATRWIELSRANVI